MNHKQKLGYTLLGAVIMAVGIIIGQWGTPGHQRHRTSRHRTLIGLRRSDVGDSGGG